MLSCITFLAAVFLAAMTSLWLAPRRSQAEPLELIALGQGSSGQPLAVGGEAPPVHSAPQTCRYFPSLTTDRWDKQSLVVLQESEGHLSLAHITLYFIRPPCFPTNTPFPGDAASVPGTDLVRGIPGLDQARLELSPSRFSFLWPVTFCSWDILILHSYSHSHTSLQLFGSFLIDSHHSSHDRSVFNPLYIRITWGGMCFNNRYLDINPQALVFVESASGDSHVQPGL